MARIEVNISPSVIGWIIEKAAFSGVSEKINILLRSWLNGEKKPTFHQVEEVSKKTHIPFGFFFMDSPPEEECSIVEYRTIDSIARENPSRELIDTVNTMLDVQDWMSMERRSKGDDPYSFVGKFDYAEADAIETADNIRHELEIDMDWFRKSKSGRDSFKLLRKQISDLGIMVMQNGIVGNNTHRKLSVHEFRAFTLVDQYAPLIFINSRDSVNGKLFSLLHELSHIWVGINSFYNEPHENDIPVSHLETFCNAVAAEILVPEDIFLSEWNSSGDEDHLETVCALSNVFHCSSFVLCRRARDKGFISQEDYLSLNDKLKKRAEDWQENRGKSDGGNFYNSLQSKWDHNFIRNINASAMNGETSYTELYRLTGTTGKTFDQLLSKIGGA